MKSGDGQARGALSTPSNNVIPEEPISEAVRLTLLVGLPFFAINAIIKSILIYSVFSCQDMKKFRICLLLRFLAILDCLLMILLFGLPWLGLLLPFSSDLDYDSRGKLCVVASYLKMTLVDLVTYTLLLAGLERLYCLANKPYRSYFAIAFVSQSQCRIHNIFTRLLLVVFVPVIMAVNLPHLCGNWPTTKDSKSGECLNPWRILGDDDEDAATIRNHTILGYSVAVFVLLLGWTLKCTKPKAAPRAVPKTRKLVKKEATHKETSFSHPPIPPHEGETADTQPIIQTPAGGTPASLTSTPKFFKIYLTVQMCKIRGRDIGFHLVTCDKTAVPTRKREVEFDNMVLGYALVYLIFQAPQILLQSIGSIIAAHCDPSTLMTLSVATDIIAGNRPAFVFFLYTLMSLGHFGNIVAKIITTIFSCACLRRRSRYEESITLSVVN
ncbi:hypothetical protein C0Q70_06393 [Pomacea canaliculata]|uniref:Uncharacterized protein n=1 Tax=Pomacea canaliculata TaxID=400727 RepID=A0A2T7PNX0_POMCA|nr:hypothetical protein C0Q70_06393 [Pomacea canaliculata]